MRVAIVASHPIQYQAPLFRRLAASPRLQVEVLFLSRHGLEPTFDADFGRKIAFDVPLVQGYPHRFLRNLSPRPTLARFWGLLNPGLIRLLRYDVVVVHGHAHLSEWLAYALCALRGIPYMLRGDTRGDAPSRLTGPRLVLKRWLIRRLIRGAAGCLAIGAHNRAYYLAHGADPQRVFFVPYSVDNQLFQAAGERGRAHRRERLSALGLDPDHPVVLFSAKLVPRKRPLDLLRAVARLDRPVSLLFLGDGPLRAELEREARSLPGARFLGFVNQVEIGEWYGTGDFLVLPSEMEPWGLVVNEAMAAGAVPVVSSAVGCAPDLVTPETGRVFPTGDVEGLAAALQALLLSPIEREAVQRKIAEYAIEATAAGLERAVLGRAWPSRL